MSVEPLVRRSRLSLHAVGVRLRPLLPVAVAGEVVAAVVVVVAAVPWRVSCCTPDAGSPACSQSRSSFLPCGVNLCGVTYLLKVSGQQG